MGIEKPRTRLYNLATMTRLIIDERGGCVYKDGRRIVLRPQLLRFLAYLAQQGRVVPSKEIQGERSLWEEGTFPGPGDVTKLVARLRDAIEEDPKRPQIVINRRRYGYRISENVEVEFSSLSRDERPSTPIMEREAMMWALHLGMAMAPACLFCTPKLHQIHQSLEGVPEDTAKIYRCLTEPLKEPQEALRLPELFPEDFEAFKKDPHPDITAEMKIVTKLLLLGGEKLVSAYELMKELTILSGLGIDDEGDLKLGKEEWKERIRGLARRANLPSDPCEKLIDYIYEQEGSGAGEVRERFMECFEEMLDYLRV